MKCEWTWKVAKYTIRLLWDGGFNFHPLSVKNQLQLSPAYRPHLVGRKKR